MVSSMGLTVNIEHPSGLIHEWPTGAECPLTLTIRWQDGYEWTTSEFSVSGGAEAWTAECTLF